MNRLFVVCFICLLSFSCHLMAWDLAIVSMFRNNAAYLKEWIEYHHMVGVEHFWLYNDDSTDEWKEVLQPYIDQGLVEVFYWPSMVGPGPRGSWVPKQMEAFRDGLSRARQKAVWVALIDSDEFLLPLKDKTVSECLKNHFSHVQAVYANWRNFGTSHVVLKKNEPMLFRLTACSKRDHSRNHIGKTIVRPESVRLEEVYYPHHVPLVPGACYADGDGNQTLTAAGADWRTDGDFHDTYIQINHYCFRDETYFKEVRLPRDSDPKLLLQLYKQFNKDQDYTMTKFITKQHPDMYDALWK